MMNDVTRVQVASIWCAGIAVAAAAAIVAGAPLTVSSLEWLLAVGFVPPALMLLLWRVPVPLAGAVHAESSPARRPS
jgi:hypothetical protein